MNWTVILHRRVSKTLPALPAPIRKAFHALLSDIEMNGPVRGNWPNYSKLVSPSGRRHHCHLRKGRPTFVAVWEEHEGNIRLVEVTYAGTHEKAPY